MCLILRNLPYTADRIALKKLLMKFGAVRYCRLMMNQVTGTATGSAFVQFMTSSAAQKCLQAAKGPENSLLYEGQLLSVAIALPRSELRGTGREGNEKQEKGDKRNLYLAKEGG